MHVRPHRRGAVILHLRSERQPRGVHRKRRHTGFDVLTDLHDQARDVENLDLPSGVGVGLKTAKESVYLQ